jgi:hypothetical protein
MAISICVGIIALYTVGRIRSRIFKVELKNGRNNISETKKYKSNLERTRFEKCGIYIFGVILMQGEERS